ncbi:MAG TPA: bifunctional glycosyltransferase family 2 protein/CDP-glycerol:glycerophosphate glycerophosphotransferase [Streptosporangiaceae bacterium]|nr:bifunctional glycosyltransferase family 2 protein/CDP-glycerol:glycerophosphate glycerophosphotransferase [Streptosporangiaceae bacterium]
MVVPFYNNVDLLGDCLDSIAAQTFIDLRVVMVDDGSTDGSTEVAAKQAADDPRFTLVRVPNGGPGSARNHGVAAATGEFLAFVDADDLIPPDAYERQLAVLEASGSDFACGAVLRLTGDELGPSGLHDQAIKARRIGTHISKATELLYDISVFNKLFRRSFWDAACAGPGERAPGTPRGLRFPEGMLWEDLVAMTKAHVLARAVDVVTEPVYYWRDRDKGAPSITQSRMRIGNFRDRITALTMIDDFLREKSTPDLLRAHQHKALVNDLWLYVRDLSGTGDDYQREFTELAGGYLRQVDHRVVTAMPATRKLAYYLITAGRQDDLVAYSRWLAANPGRTPPIVRSFGRLRADLPLRRPSAGASPASPASPAPGWVFKPQFRELDPQVQVTRLSWRGRTLVIEGSAYVPSMDIVRRRNTTKLVVLVPRDRRKPPIVLPARSVRDPEVTAASGQDRYSYDWAGFRCEISPRWFGWFGPGGRWLTGDWDCFVLVRGRSVWRPARLHSPGPGAENPEPVQVGPGVSFGAHWAGRRLQVRVRRGSPTTPAEPHACVTGAWSPDGSFLLKGTVPADWSGPVELRHLDGWERHSFPITASTAARPDGNVEFSAEVPVAAIDTFGDPLPLRDGRWAVGLPGLEVLPASVDRRTKTFGRKKYCAGPGLEGSGLVLEVGPALGVAERGRIRRRLLRDLYYPLQRRLPVRPAILFLSFDGKSCNDNPLAIAAELRRRGDSREQIWAVDDWSVKVPPGARAVLIGSAGYLAALGRSAYLIANDHVALPFSRRAGQKYVQTWHGTPLKRLGYDIASPSFVSGRRYFDFMDGDVAQWDLLISPNPFSTPIWRQAFKYSGEIAETGYPRNDVLLTRDAERESLIRARLGLPAGKRVAMYVPTWRDNQHDGTSRYGLDLRLDLAAASERLAQDYVLLIRGHHLMAGWKLAEAGGADTAEPGFVFDVTAYPDINDLLRITDVLITDYSSVSFDFAPTGRPMLFFTYDLAEYRDKLRGFYFDFEESAPGPLLSTSEEVIAALADLEPVVAESKPAYDAFTARFCPLDDGKAASRACDRIFGD